MRNASAAELFQYIADSCPSLIIQQEYFEQISFPGAHQHRETANRPVQKLHKILFKKLR